MRILILDDDLDRVAVLRKRLDSANTPYVLKHVLGTDTFIETLNEQFTHWDVIMLDHDLGMTRDVDDPKRMIELTARPAALYIQDNSRRFTNTEIIIHSLNNYGAANLYGIITSIGDIKAYVIPSAWTKAKLVDGSLVFEL